MGREREREREKRERERERETYIRKLVTSFVREEAEAGSDK